MKIILNIVIACLILLSSNALNISSSKRRTSTEAAAYMKLTSLLGYTNGYKALGGFGNSKTVTYFCDLLINKKSVIQKIEKSVTKEGSTTSSTSSETERDKYNLRSSFQITVKTIREVSTIESNNSVKLIQGLQLPEKLKNDLFLQVGNLSVLKLDPLKIADVTKHWEPQIIQITLRGFEEYNVQLVIMNFQTFSKSTSGEANEKSIQDLQATIVDQRKIKLKSLREKLASIEIYFVNLQTAINLKIMFLKKQEQKSIYEGEITRIGTLKTQCLNERARLKKLYLGYELTWVETGSKSNLLKEQVITCTSTVESYDIRITSIKEKIKTDVNTEKTKLEAKIAEAYTHIFYWLEASYYYRVYDRKLVANVDDVKVKFSESKLKSNSVKVSEVFYPIVTDLTFFDN